MVSEYPKAKIGYQKGTLDKNAKNLETVGDKKILPKVKVLDTN